MCKAEFVWMGLGWSLFYCLSYKPKSIVDKVFFYYFFLYGLRYFLYFYSLHSLMIKKLFPIQILRNKSKFKKKLKQKTLSPTKSVLKSHINSEMLNYYWVQLYKMWHICYCWDWKPKNTGRKKEKRTCNLRYSGCLCSPLMPSTCTVSNSTCFSIRHTITFLGLA